MNAWTDDDSRDLDEQIQAMRKAQRRALPVDLKPPRPKRQQSVRRNLKNKKDKP